MAYNTTTHTVKFGSGNVNTGNIKDSFNTTIQQSDEDAQILCWLSPLEPGNRHHGVRTERFEGVGDWLLETGEFRKWRGGEGEVEEAVFFCSGNPGVGKTYLTSLVIDRLCDDAREEDLAVAWLYCDFLAQQEQTMTNIMGAILKQLVGMGDIPKDIRMAFQEAKRVGGRRPLLPDLVGMLRTAIASLPQVFICVDALDECLPKGLPELLGSLRDIVRESPRTRIFLTGRPHVKEAIQRYFNKAAVVPISPNQDDIMNYLEMRLDRDDEPEAMDNELRVDIVRIILEKMSDIFLLVSLNIDAILGGVTIGQRRKKLQEMARGNGLSDAYTATLTRLKAQKGNKSELGLKVLMWVLNSRRPLKAEELRHALGVEIGSADIDPKSIPAVKTLLSSCLGLVTVESSSSTVRLVHFTLQEHLASDITLSYNPHTTIAEVCLTYLNFGSVRDLSPTPPSAPLTFPFLDYASRYWGEHATKGMTENVKVLVLGLLDKFDEHVSSTLLLLGDGDYKYLVEDAVEEGGRIAFTGLHGAAFFGIIEIFASLFAMKEWDVNATDFIGRTALTWAAERGHVTIVKILLEREEVNPDQADRYLDWTPLVYAASNGHGEVVNMLLERKDVNPNVEDPDNGGTALTWAAEGGHIGVIKMLLECESVNPNKELPESGPTLLFWAAQKGHEGVVKQLLKRDDLDPNTVDEEYGDTLLGWAVDKNNEGILRLLLKRKDVDPNYTDTPGGRASLSWAAGLGNEAIVKVLLERKDVNPDQVDTEDSEYGRTPLSLAAKNGHAAVVKMLLQREDINPDQAGTECGATPLLLAAKNGHEGVVKILLEREDVEPNRADLESGATPLSVAAEEGHVGVVKMLLEREDVNPNQHLPETGKTLLFCAAESGHDGVVKMLLGREDLNPDGVNAESDEPLLLWAVQNGNEGLVKMLLERRDVNPNTVNSQNGRTPLSSAAHCGNEGIVKMLLGREDVNPDYADAKYSRTPLSLAAERGHERVVGMLLERDGVKLNTPDTWYGRTPLAFATWHRHSGVVKILLQRDDVNPNIPDSRYGRTPLFFAAENGDQEVVKMLLERKDIHTAIQDNQNQTPLSLALSQGHHEVVRILQGRDQVNSNALY